MQGLELLIGLAGLLGRGDHGLYLFNNVEFLLQILFLLCLLLAELLLPALLDDAHLGLEYLLGFVGGNLISFGVAATVDVFPQLGFALGDVQFVEGGFQVVNLVFLWGFLAVGNLLHSLQNLGLCGVDLVLFGCFNFRSFRHCNHLLFCILFL